MRCHMLGLAFSRADAKRVCTDGNSHIRDSWAWREGLESLPRAEAPIAGGPTFSDSNDFHQRNLKTLNPYGVLTGGH